jgi:TPR repeat protein
MYYKGDGVDTDYAEALKYFRLSAAQGNPSGQMWIGEMYEMGFGVNQDKAIARSWYENACKGGYKRACQVLNGNYHYGIGGSQKRYTNP